MRRGRNQTRGAICALFTTIILLALAFLTLYNEHPPPPLYQQPADVQLLNEDERPGPAKAAAILETRQLNNLIPLILHFSAVLGPEWPIHIFTSSENKELFSSSQAFHRKMKSGEIVLEDLPVGLPNDFHFHEQYLFSEFLIQPWLWEQLAPAEHVLLFRADSMICSKSEKSLDDFLEYDFIGAPLKDEDGVSGQLSLRKTARVLEVVMNSDWQSERHGDREPDGTPKPDYEARWFWKKMKGRPLEGDGTAKAYLPSMEVARSFSGAIDDQPLLVGHDQVQKDQGDMKEILEWCPEYSLSINEK